MGPDRWIPTQMVCSYLADETSSDNLARSFGRLWLGANFGSMDEQAS